MTTPFLGEIQLFGFNFAPYQWALCNGTTLAIQQNTALFSLLGTTYGGNGTTTFQLPNLAARAPCNQGQGPGLTPRRIGEAFGTVTATADLSQMPAHTHALNLFEQTSNTKRSGTPSIGNGLSNTTKAAAFAVNASPNAPFAPNSIGSAGTTQPLPHENRQPYLAVNFCIALSGVFPSFG